MCFNFNYCSALPIQNEAHLLSWTASMVYVKSYSPFLIIFFLILLSVVGVKCIRRVVPASIQLPHLLQKPWIAPLSYKNYTTRGESQGCLQWKVFQAAERPWRRTRFKFNPIQVVSIVYTGRSWSYEPPFKFILNSNTLEEIDNGRVQFLVSGWMQQLSQFEDSKVQT